MQNDNGNLSKEYTELLNNRNNLLQKSTNLNVQADIKAKEDLLSGNNISKSIQNALIERGQINLTDTNAGAEINNVKPFNLDNELSNSISQSLGEDLPLYQNIKDLEDMDTQDPMKRIELLERERQSLVIENNNSETNETANIFNNNNLVEGFNNNNTNGNNNNDNNDNNNRLDTGILSYKDLNVEQQSNMLAKMTSKRGESDVMHERNQTDLITYNQSVQKDPADLYRISKDGENRLLKSMTEGSIGNNDVRALNPLIDNLLLEKLMTLQRDLQPKYIEKTHYVIVNSLDRNWQGGTSQTRYNFSVNFNKDSENLEAGVQDIYKNVVSIETTMAILPQDSTVVPFDSRVYIDILQYPYLLLNIPELDDVFRGTNSINDKAFSVLIFDKQNDSQVFSSDYITSDAQATTDSQYHKQYKKSFYKFTPAYFEKKTYYNSPLASLNKMTLNLTMPNGVTVNTLPDVLNISAIGFLPTVASGQVLKNLTDSDFEYAVSHDFPNTDGDSRYIKITTSTSFSNKHFNLGDKIIIKGVTTTSATNSETFTNFINRDEGHYILNLDKSTLANNENQGITNNIYIAPSW